MIECHVAKVSFDQSGSGESGSGKSGSGESGSGESGVANFLGAKVEDTKCISQSRSKAK